MSDPNASRAIDQQVETGIITTTNGVVGSGASGSIHGNLPPTASNLAFSTSEDTPAVLTLTGADPEGSQLTFSIPFAPAHGTLGPITMTGLNTAAVTYTPAPNFNGVDTFTFAVADPAEASAVATTYITVTPVNDSPVAAPQTVGVPKKTPTSVTLSASDVDGDPLTYAVVTQPAHGKLVGTPPNLTYTPTNSYTGTDSFRFKANDGSLDSALATASLVIAVGSPPTVPAASSDIATQNTPKTLTLSGADANNDDLAFSIVSPPSHGSLGVITSAGPASATVTYTPAANYSGADAFTFKANDGLFDSNVGAFSLNISAVNHAPTVTTPMSVSSGVNVLLTITLTGADLDNDDLTFAIVTPPAHGSLSPLAKTGRTAASVGYTPATNYTGADSFAFKANDGQADSALGTCSVTVNNQPPVANAQSVNLSKNIAAAVTLTATDADGDPLTYAVVTPPAHGALTGAAPNLTYTPATGYTSADAFTFKANDGHVDSAPATVSLTIAVGSPPVPNASSNSTNEDTAKTLTLTGSDVDNDVLTFSIFAQPAHGTLGPVTSTSANSATVLYTPAANYNGPDSFTFKAYDGLFVSGAATFSLTVISVNDAPVVTASTNSSVAEDTPISLSLKGSDVDNNALTFSLVSPPAHGTLGPVTSASTNSATVLYTPAANYSGADSFTYWANDGTTNSNVGAYIITVTPVNDCPTLSTNQQNLAANTNSLNTDPENQFTLIANDVDAVGASLRWSLLANGASTNGGASIPTAIGTATILSASTNTSSGGTILIGYRPNANTNGGDSFVVRVDDGQGCSTNCNVTVAVGGFSVTGTVTRIAAGGATQPVPSLVLAFTDSTGGGANLTAVTNTNGVFTGFVPRGWSGTVMAASTNDWRLTPASLSFTNASTNQTGLSFSAARNYYVSTNGSNANPGTLSSPYLSVDRGMSMLQPGDTVYIRSGDYTTPYNPRFANSGQPGNPITIQGYPGDARPRLTRAPSSPYSSVFIIDESGWGNFIFKDLVIYLAGGGYGIQIAPAQLPKVTDVRVENVEFHDLDSAIRVELYSVERMYIKGCYSHECYSSEGAFDFKVNVVQDPTKCDLGSQYVVIQDCSFYDIPQAISAGVIAQESTRNFIFINNMSHHTGEKSFDCKSGGYNIFINNYGYDQSKATYYLREQNNPTSVPGLTLTGCGKSNNLLINNVGITRKHQEGDQGVIKKWEDTNIWCYNNTFVSLKQIIDTSINGAPFTFDTPVHTSGPDTAYLKNNIAYKVEGEYDMSVFANRDPDLRNLAITVAGNVWFVENLGNQRGFWAWYSSGTAGYTLSQFQTLTSSPNNNAWGDPLFTSLTASDDTLAQDLHLRNGSPARGAGQPYSNTDPNDYPMKAQEFLIPYNGFSGFNILSPAERQALIDLVMTAHLRDRDGVVRNVAHPSAGAFE